MTVLKLLPVIVSFLLIGAHFLRSGHMFYVVLCVLFIGLLFVRKPLAAWLVQAALVLATVEWIHTVFVFASVRIEQGKPYFRLVLILGVVAFFTLASTLVFFLKSMKERYSL